MMFNPFFKQPYGGMPQGMGDNFYKDGRKPYKKNYNGNGNYSGYNNNNYNKSRGGRNPKKGDSPTINVNEADFPPLDDNNPQ